MYYLLRTWRKDLLSFLIENSSERRCKLKKLDIFKHSQYVNHELQMFELVLEKTEEPEIKLSISAGSSKNQESSRKTSISALLTMPKPLTV